jgi:hypothetical protein
MPLALCGSSGHAHGARDGSWTRRRDPSSASAVTIRAGGVAANCGLLATSTIRARSASLNDARGRPDRRPVGDLFAPGGHQPSIAAGVSCEVGVSVATLEPETRNLSVLETGSRPAANLHAVSRVSCVAEVLGNGAIVIAGTIPRELIEIDLVEDDAGDAVHHRPQNPESFVDAGT